MNPWSLKCTRDALLVKVAFAGFFQGGENCTTFATKMEYTRVQIRFKQGGHTDPEVLIAWLGELPFDTLEEEDGGLSAYLPTSHWDGQVQKEIQRLADEYAFVWEATVIPPQNWNELWESNFQPILVHDFVGVRAEFHPVFSGVEHELVIQPRMAFGTGHHQTTWMMMEAMRGLEFKGKGVFDYGCGTGILAILAGKLGATEIHAVDIEEESFLNTLQNAERNGVDLQVWHGILEEVPVTQYDVVLANINRNVLLDTLPALTKRLTDGAVLLLSGFHIVDIPHFEGLFQRLGWTIEHTRSLDPWCMLQVRSGASKV